MILLQQGLISLLELLQLFLEIVDDQVALVLKLCELLAKLLEISALFLEESFVISHIIQMATKSVQKVVQECLKILRSETAEATQKWISDNKITSLTLRNVKALQIISLANYMLQKMLINPREKQHHLLTLLYEYHKRNYSKCHEFSRLTKHFSQWDYEFEFIYNISLDQNIDQLGLYMRLREAVLRSEFNKAKKELLSGISAQLQEWAGLSRIVFKDKEEEDVIDQFTTVVKNHYVNVKKSQAEKINGAEFLRICQIMDNSDLFRDSQAEVYRVNKKVAQKQGDQGEKIVSIFDETLLNGLSSQDKELIRVLSYRDKNIARMLEQKHTKMVHLIADEVNRLRKDINIQKQRYMQIVEEKNALMRLVERIKQSGLKFVVQKSQASEAQLLQLLDVYNKKYNPKAVDVARTIDLIQNRRLIQIIEREQLEPDDIQ